MRRSLLAFVVCSTLPSAALAQPPKSLDPRLEIVPFAASPDIVHPIAVDFDSKGRLLVVESHTHFRPKGYKGPETDRIRIVEDTDGDGKADKFTTFYEGTKATMDLAVHPDGSVYVATRNEILRLRDTKGTGKADEVTRIVFLETEGNYPHNGLSGLCFDFKGDLYFGLGENLGESYVLKGQGGTTLKGGGEGGNIYWCTADGKNLRRVATGFWNPFGVCRDVFGRIFAVDNDPDSRPPCRLVHVVEGGDYGYQFRYGRSGRHPFQAWNGELPGTLPYVAGVGEAPCEVLAYESDGLPKDYLGTLLVTSWGDHRLECYPLETKGASFTAKKKVVIQGGTNFRPVGLAVAPDGSLYVSDWVRRDYNLHGQGAIWQVRMKDRKKPTESAAELWKKRVAVRSFAMCNEAMNLAGREALRKDLASNDPRVRALAIQAFAAAKADEGMESLVKNDPSPSVRALAIREMSAQGKYPIDILREVTSLDKIQPEVLAAVLDSSTSTRALAEAWSSFESNDPFLRHAAVRFYVQGPVFYNPFRRYENGVPPRDLNDKKVLGLFLALRDRGILKDEYVRTMLQSPIDDVRFLTAKWISDEVIKEAREPLDKAMKDPNLNSRLFVAYATALARLDGEPVNETRLAEAFLRRAKDEMATPAARVAALRMVPASFKGLTTEQLVKWTTDASPAMRLEAVRALVDQTGAKRWAALLALYKNPPRFGKDDGGIAIRREVMVGMADRYDEHVDEILKAIDFKGPADEHVKRPLAADALRALVPLQLKHEDRDRIEKLVEEEPKLRQEVDRIFRRPIRSKEAQAADVNEWLKRLEGAGDKDAGRRIFFHPRVGSCYKCHRVDGRGQNVGPDLSTIGQRDKTFLLESILFPSREVAPQFQTWQVETADGKVRTGLLVHTDVDQATYVDEKGNRFTVPVHETDVRAVPTSIMPDGLAATLTDQELRDLLAYLTSRK